MTSSNKEAINTYLQHVCRPTKEYTQRQYTYCIQCTYNIRTYVAATCTVDYNNKIKVEMFKIYPYVRMPFCQLITNKPEEHTHMQHTYTRIQTDMRHSCE